MRLILLVSLVVLPFTVAAPQATPPATATTDWSVIEQVLGRAPTEQSGIRKVVFWRTDFPAFVGNTRLAPAAALSSWIAFREIEKGVIADGDLALLSREVPGAMDALLGHGFEITALHNHLLRERPTVMYVHIFGRGQLANMVAGLKEALAATHTPTAVADAKPSPGTIAFDRKTIEDILGKEGTPSGPVLGFSFPRAEEITVHGNVLAPAMGLATSINFQPARAGVATTGDFVLKESEVTPVISALRKGGVLVTAIHNHLLDESPRLVFVHFWAENKEEPLARALRSALDQVH